MLCPCSANVSRSSRGRSKPAANHSDSHCDFPLLCLTCSKRLGNRTIFGLRSTNPLLSGNNMTAFSIQNSVVTCMGTNATDQSVLSGQHIDLPTQVLQPG